MGCVSSKKLRSPHTSPDQHSRHRHRRSRRHDRHGRRYSSSKSSDGHGSLDGSVLSVKGGGSFGHLEKIEEVSEKEVDEESVTPPQSVISKAPPKKAANNEKRSSAFSIKFGRLTEGEQSAAGWPAWLSAVAGEAIHGWLPLRSDSFERLDKIGQGTYSSVYRARNVETGQIVALKKVRFDNFQPESVRFMAREITILRKLDHPNVMKLEGIITSRLSCSIYLVFEYMEHDLAGLLSCPDVKFTESQIKCYMKQLLSGVEHCHNRGVMHRDLKSSNILVNNEGVLKIGDFGLANFVTSRHKQPLTNRVVTLWYRPPELLLGSTNYGVTVDLWSVGCIFAELFVGRPLLKGRTEVEQLHKIFKLCGSPPEAHWENSNLPLAAMFKPQQPYDSTLWERCKELPRTAVSLIETFLSIEPSDRGTASSSLNSEYFHSKPYACDPSTLPKYPPNKEIDAKHREEARRNNGNGSVVSRSTAASRNTTRRVRKPLQEQSISYKGLRSEEMESYLRRNNVSKGRATDTMSQASEMTAESYGGSSVVSDMVTSSAYRQKQDLRSYGQDSSDDIRKRAMQIKRSQHRRIGSFDSSEIYQSQELSSSQDYADQQDRTRSGPMSYQPPRRNDPKQDSQSRDNARRSRFYRDY